MTKSSMKSCVGIKPLKLLRVKLIHDVQKCNLIPFTYKQDIYIYIFYVTYTNPTYSYQHTAFLAYVGYGDSETHEIALPTLPIQLSLQTKLLINTK
jgi:hypothetical protein